MLTQEEAAKLRIKARHGELTPEEQLMYSEYMESQGVRRRLRSPFRADRS